MWSLLFPENISKYTGNQRLKDLYSNEETLLFEAENSVDLCKKINILLENEELKKILTKNVYYKSNNYPYTTRCKKIIEELLDKN